MICNKLNPKPEFQSRKAGMKAVVKAFEFNLFGLSYCCLPRMKKEINSSRYRETKLF